MSLRSITKKSMFILFCLSLQAQGAQDILSNEQIEARAAKLLPNQSTHYTLQDIEPIFHPILVPAAREKFDTYFQILFDRDFPPPSHLPENLVEGYRCLYTKLMLATFLDGIADKTEAQITAIYQVMGFHKRRIAEFREGIYRSLAEDIPQLAVCPNCVGMPKKPYKHQPVEQ